MIQNLILGIHFLKILFKEYKVLYSPARSSGHYQSFFNFKFSKKVAKPTKTSKRDHSFYSTVSLKKRYSFYEPQLT